MIETTTVALDGLDFTVAMAGPAAGAPVLLLHGFPETHHMWRAQLEALADAGYRAIAPDQRGYSPGARPQGVEHYATDRLIGDALALMSTLGAARFHLVGHDWGGQIAWLLTAANAARVASLAVLSRPHPAAFTRALKEDAAQAERSRHHRTFLEEKTLQRLREQNLRPLHEVLLAQGVPTFDADIYINALRPPGAFEAAINWYRAGTLRAADTPAIEVPTLYVWGNEDATVGRYAAELTASYVRGPYRFVAIEAGGHFVIDQCPARISALLLEHLRAQASQCGA